MLPDRARRAADHRVLLRQRHRLRPVEAAERARQAGRPHPAELERVAHGGVHRREDSTHAASLLGSMETRSACVGDAEKLPARRDQHERARGVITC
jgi:hypothetical protein